MSVIEFKNHNEEFDRSCPLCDVIKVDGQLYVHISKVEVFQNQLQQKGKEIERLNNIINKIDKLFEVDTHCEDIYYAIGVVLNKKYHDIEMISNEEILNILGSDKE